MADGKFARLLADSHFVVMGGHGGVGKTTLSAAIALENALHGRRVALLTIDPARRLGATLGVRNLGNRLKTIDLKKVHTHLNKDGGRLSVAMLDVKGTFDDMVARYAPSPAIRDRILANSLYDQLSRSLSGTHEYMALERIYEIRSSDEFDLLIIDTPPTSAFGDFLKAPERIQRFFHREVLKWFMPKLPIGIGLGMAWALFQKLTGGTVLSEVSSFLVDFQSLFEGLAKRADAISNLLKDRNTAFVCVVTSDTNLDGIPESLSLRGLVFNRWLTTKTEVPELRPVARILLSRQRKSMAAFKKNYPDVSILKVPLQAKDPTTLSELAELLGSGIS
jgi:anion-transporting  ArsA/GET3 family ATPase